MKSSVISFAVFFVLMALVPTLSLSGHSQPPANTSSGSSSFPPSSVASESSSVSSLQSSSSTAVGTSFKILDQSSGNILTVPDQEFLLGAVAAEMPTSYHTEALRAQAVAAYTYYSKKRNEQKSSPSSELKGADFICDTANWLTYVTKEAMQKRWGDSYEKNYGILKAAVESIGLKQLIYQGKPAMTTYYAISAGTTEDAKDVWGSAIDYLVPVASPGDLLAPGYLSTVTLTPEQFRETLLKTWPDAKLDNDPQKWLGEIKKTDSGMVSDIQVGDQTIQGMKFRMAFSLRSADFDAKYEDGNFQFTVRGYGHGVGMSQYGADYMARQGADYTEILKWYYPGTTLTDITSAQ